VLTYLCVCVLCALCCRRTGFEFEFSDYRGLQRWKEIHFFFEGSLNVYFENIGVVKFLCNIGRFNTVCVCKLFCRHVRGILFLRLIRKFGEGV